MKAVVRNVLAVLAGLVAGSLVNGGLIMISGKVIPPPSGADVTTLEGLKASLHLFEPKHFLFPFLAHALGTLTGSLVAAALAASRKTVMAFVVGSFFLAGGLANVVMLPGPLWFETLDLVAAYLPMAWIGARLATRTASKG
ncbi:MAG: hypothetical protein IT186_21000 [Acidobacteria bacterium]|nr:hypothetical protein [Acidobacteriota bacterium]